ncbi:MAG: four helix bundle protein, partial [Phycisphaerales bacterium]|nr:four helix bundle protein [Phycisphaerales bacterium]
MAYKRFEDLPVWISAIALAEAAFSMADAPAGRAGLRDAGDLRSQLLRATISVSNNIAEGFERGTTAELIAFLYIARGSAGEVRSMLCLMERLGRFSDLKSEISDLKSRAESCSRQLRAWADSLQNSEIKGPRHLNDSVRRQEALKRSRAAFLERLEEPRPRFEEPAPPASDP